MIKFLLVTLVSSHAWATVPFANLEGLRSFTVVARVALDNPGSADVKKCGVGQNDVAVLGQKLALVTENMKAQTSHFKITTADAATLKLKISSCEVRGSCSVYRDYLEVAQIADASVKAEVETLKKDLDTKLATLKSATFVQAWKSVKTPCNYLKQLISWK